MTRQSARIVPDQKGRFPVFLRNLRERLNLSQQDLAVRLGTAVATISRWELGKSDPAFTVAQMKAFLGLLEEAGYTLDQVPD